MEVLVGAEIVWRLRQLPADAAILKCVSPAVHTGRVARLS